VESTLRSFVSTRPDNPITETGVLSELKAHGLRSRLGKNRADVVHHPMDPVIVGAPWVLGAGLVYKAVRGLTRRRSS
jgi:hypothetical protein